MHETTFFAKRSLVPGKVSLAVRGVGGGDFGRPGLYGVADVVLEGRSGMQIAEVEIGRNNQYFDTANASQMSE